MRSFCLSVHLLQLVYSTAHHAGSRLAAPGLLLGARRGGTRAPRLWEAGAEPACVPRDDGRDVTYKGSPVANLCSRILSFSICLSVWWVFFPFIQALQDFGFPEAPGEGERARNAVVF